MQAPVKADKQDYKFSAEKEVREDHQEKEILCDHEHRFRQQTILGQKEGKARMKAMQGNLQEVLVMSCQ